MSGSISNTVNDLAGTIGGFTGGALGNFAGGITSGVVGDPSQATQPLEDFTPTGFQSSGLSGTVQDGTFQLTRSDALSGALGGLQSALQGRAGEFAALRGGLNRDIAPLIGNLRTAGVDAIRGRSRRAIGDLRENLARRRIAGSSFAADAVSRAEAEFAKQEAEFGAQAGVKEFELNQQLAQMDADLLDKETQANIEGFQSQLNQMNLESGLAAQLSSQMSQLSAENARAIGDILAQFAAARAGIAGTAAGAGTALAASLSDKRTKKIIKQVGYVGKLPLYIFRYLWDKVERTGFMAQDVQKFYPNAVIEQNGLLYIDYIKLRKQACH